MVEASSPERPPLGRAEASFSVVVPKVEAPKGGGAVRGIGEKFAANPVTGTGSMSVPIAASPGRAGFGPQLALSYDSGAGNGPFGLGWSLPLPAITRKTERTEDRGWAPFVPFRSVPLPPPLCSGAGAARPRSASRNRWLKLRS